MKSVFDRFHRMKNKHNASKRARGVTGAVDESAEVRDSGFPLVPDAYHLEHVGKTAQGNGFWIDRQLVNEKNRTRDFVAAYVFDTQGNLISSEVVDCGLRGDQPRHAFADLVERLKTKIDAKERSEILVKPFAVTYYGHTFGLIIRETEESDASSEETLIDAMPGHTLMFYGPWSSCNYDT